MTSSILPAVRRIMAAPRSVIGSKLPSATPGMGARAAEQVASRVGSWPFIIAQTLFLLCWFTWNAVPGLPHFDPVPWLMANILMSMQAALTGPILLIAANVSAARAQRQTDRMEQLEQTIDAHVAALRELIIAQTTAATPKES